MKIFLYIFATYATYAQITSTKTGTLIDRERDVRDRHMRWFISWWERGCMSARVEDQYIPLKNQFSVKFELVECPKIEAHTHTHRATKESWKKSEMTKQSIGRNKKKYYFAKRLQICNGVSSRNPRSAHTHTPTHTCKMNNINISRVLCPPSSNTLQSVHFNFQIVMVLCHSTLRLSSKLCIFMLIVWQVVCSLFSLLF